MEYPVRVRSSLLWHLVRAQMLVVHPVRVDAPNPNPDHLEERAPQSPRCVDPFRPPRSRHEMEPRAMRVVSRAMAAALRRRDVGQLQAVPFVVVISFQRPHSTAPAIGQFLPCLAQQASLFLKELSID